MQNEDQKEAEKRSERTPPESGNMPRSGEPKPRYKWHTIAAVLAIGISFYFFGKETRACFGSHDSIFSGFRDCILRGDVLFGHRKTLKEECLERLAEELRTPGLRVVCGHDGVGIVTKTDPNAVIPQRENTLKFQR